MELGLLSTNQLLQTTLWKRSAERIRKHWTNLNDAEFRLAVVHDLIDIQVSDVLQASQCRLSGITSFAEALTKPILIAPSTEIAEMKSEVEAFLLERVYRHPNVMLHRSRIADWIEAIFDHYVTKPEQLPERYATVLSYEGAKRAAGDYIADQTDRSARVESLKLS